jgi:hypothetical protein
MDINSAILSGRPFGGLAILWSKKLGHLCKPVIYEDDSNIIGLELTLRKVKYLFINIYMPYCCAQNRDNFVSNLSQIDSIIRSCGTPYVFIMGDFNADPNKVHLFGQELAEYCNDVKLVLSDTTSP